MIFLLVSPFSYPVAAERAIDDVGHILARDGLVHAHADEPPCVGDFEPLDAAMQDDGEQLRALDVEDAVAHPVLEHLLEQHHLTLVKALADLLPLR